MSRAKMFMVAIVGVLALSGVASSMANAVWMINNANFTSGTKAIANTAKVDEEGILTAANAEVSCAAPTLKGVNPVINGANGTGEAASLEFEQCSGNAVCPLAASQGGKVSTLPIVVDLTLDGTLAVKGNFLPANTSKLFATIKFEGPECSLKGVQPVKGFAPFLAPTGQDERTLQQINALPNEKGLEVGKTEAKLKGSILVRLVSGEPFSFL